MDRTGIPVLFALFLAIFAILSCKSFLVLVLWKSLKILFASQEEAAMNKDILAILQEMEPTFSKGQKRIARYITESYDKAAFMTANKLGKTVGVSESTVVRFAVDLGFDGYPSMQKAMREMVLNRLTSVQRLEVASDRYGNQDVITTVLHSDMEKLRQTGEIISREDFSASVSAIL